MDPKRRQSGSLFLCRKTQKLIGCAKSSQERSRQPRWSKKWLQAFTYHEFWLIVDGLLTEFRIFVAKNCIGFCSPTQYPKRKKTHWTNWCRNACLVYFTLHARAGFFFLSLPHVPQAAVGTTSMQISVGACLSQHMQSRPQLASGLFTFVSVLLSDMQAFSMSTFHAGVQV